MIAKHLIEEMGKSEQGGVFIVDSKGNWSMIDSVFIDKGGNINLKIWIEDLILTPEKTTKE